jgi:hypothetical protein
VEYLSKFLKRSSHAEEAARLNISGRLARASETLAHVSLPGYLQELCGTLGAEPISSYSATDSNDLAA